MQMLMTSPNALANLVLIPEQTQLSNLYLSNDDLQLSQLSYKPIALAQLNQVGLIDSYGLGLQALDDWDESNIAPEDLDEGFI
eukprot:CAMPEP_0168621384 /NCGR_PEP_ID=MMETSP0449_2-20121227/7662_1 /TAXON_ID=1082188 /ORGANISM="Strombidium rassoulzadegani, Strain ras09" /LENGTH=82 /DNA_ID=CAMNT_0008662493 /DNA_START=17 /DNA_END=265 /DNA_ORIENTATION=+